MKNQTGIIIVQKPKQKGYRGARVILSPHGTSDRDVQRVSFLAELSGTACACLQESDKEFSQIWGSDKVLMIEARFLTEYPRQWRHQNQL